MTVTNDRSARPRPRLRTVEVKKIERSPRLVKVTLTGEDLEGFAHFDPGQHVKVFFPSEGENKPLLPVKGPEGLQFPSDVPRPVSRTYTPRRWRPKSRELEIEIVLHEDGLGSNWARDAKEGDLLVMAGPGGRFRLSLDADWYVLAADFAGVPAMSEIIETLPADKKIFAVAEVVDASDERSYNTAAQLDIRWLHTFGSHSNGMPPLEKALRELRVPNDGRGRAWVGCESSTMRAVRAYLLEAGMTPNVIHTQGYWKIGVVNHPDHDYADDE